MLLSARQIASVVRPASASCARRGSALIIALGVLAMLAIMATTFITLMRMNARLSRAYSDDLQVEMLAQGVANYCIGVLRDDQDRTMYKYANRTGVVGGRGWWQSSNDPRTSSPYSPSQVYHLTDFTFNIPGRNTDYWAAARVGGHDTRCVLKPSPDLPPADHAYGTGPSHAVWYSAATDGYIQSGLYSNSAWYEFSQPSFGGGSLDFIIVDRNDQIISNALNVKPLGTGPETYYVCAYGQMNGINDLSATWSGSTKYVYDGANFVYVPNDPNYTWGSTVSNPTPHWYMSDAGSSESNFLGNYCYDSAVFLSHGLTSYLHPGGKLTQTWEGSGGLVNQSGMMRLPGGLFWRWSAKMGVPEERYMNLNMIGNSELALSSGVSRLNNLDGNGLQAQNGDSTCRTGHLGMISWKGYSADTGSYGKFDPKYDSVSYSPYQIDPYRLLAMDVLSPNGASVPEYGNKLLNNGPFNPNTYTYPVAQICSDWISQRWTGSLAANGEDYYRPGWRRDGASYYKIPSPDNPQGGDWYYGASEALNHQDEDIIPQSSRLFNAIYQNCGQNMNSSRAAFDKTRSVLSTYGCDTILRGKLWPGESNWRNMDVLRKVNLNMLGARGQDVLSGNNTKAKWANLAAHERDRLYYMLKAMLQFTGTPDVQHQACQFVASLTDMVTWGNDESCYVAPDGSGTGAIGMKKNPVINEVAFFSNSGANTSSYNLYRLRVELYNPAENIPWIPDQDEAYDISQYVLQVGTHYFRVGTLHKFATVGNGFNDIGTIDTAPNNKIGADGLYGVPVASYYMGGTISPDPSWSRFVQVGWIGAGGTSGEFPAEVTYDELQGGSAPTTGAATFAGITFALWKPVNVPGSIPDTAYLKSLAGFSGRYMMVDTTNPIKLVRPWDPSKGEGGPGQIVNDPDGCPNRNKTNYTGVYRRWDPMNANVYEDPTLGKNRYGKGDMGTVIWCPGWTLARASTLGRPNVDYWGGTQNMFQYDDVGTVGCPIGGTAGAGKYQRVFETDYKIPCSDLPSVGWLGELFLWNCAQNGPLTLVSTSGQRPDTNINHARYLDFTNRVENAKLDLFRPWGKVHNLHLYDMFTVWDPMHDGLDNDGDGAVDEDDTGYQAGDLLGPEVRVYGCIDLNHVGNKALVNLQPGQAVAGACGMPNYGRPYDRGNAGFQGDWYSAGPMESIGDLLRMDDMRGGPGSSLGVFTSGSNWNFSDPTQTLYRRSYNLTGDAGSNYWGRGMWLSSNYVSGDADSNGIIGDRDERDYWFTQMSNFMTTRANVFTVEVVTQLTDAPKHPGSNYLRGSYGGSHNSPRVYAEKHLIMLVDRTTTLRFKPATGAADFTGPCRILARRWGHDRK